MFPSTLIDCAKTWFRKLPPGSVDSLSKLTTAFCAQFQGIKPRPKDPILLQYVIQERGKTLRLFRSFTKHPPETYQEAYNRALEQERYPTRRSPLRRSPPRAAPLKEVAWVARNEDVYNHYTPLNALRETIYLAIRVKGLLRKPGPMKVPADRRNQYNIKEGKRIQSGMQEAANRRRDGEKDLMQQIQVIHTISRGPTLAGTSNNFRKNHARKIPRLNAGHEIFKVNSRGLYNAHGIKNPAGDSRISSTTAERDDGVHRGGYTVCL
ncbi:hypothetical protein QYF36_023709 [Acer negundo]|nr:hypothetical protein QYF36_023709 [Acer negundo]